MGWEPVRWERESRGSSPGIADGTPFYFVHSFAARPADPATSLGTAEWGERFACAVERDSRLRRPVPSGEVEPRRPAPAGELHAHLRVCDVRSPRRPDPLSGDRHPRRPRGAPRPGRLRPRDAPSTTTRSTRAPRWVEQGAHGAPRRRPRRRPSRRARQPGASCDASPATSSVPVQIGGGLRDAEAVQAGARRPGRSAAVLGTAALEEPALVEALVAEHGERIVVAADARAGGSRSRDGSAAARCASPSWSQSWPPAGCGASSTRRSRSTGRSRARRSKSVGAVAAAAAATGAGSCSTRVGSATLRRPAGAGAPLGLARPGGRDRRAGAVRAALHGRRGAGRARRVP